MEPHAKTQHQVAEMYSQQAEMRAHLQEIQKELESQRAACLMAGFGVVVAEALSP